jgi:Ankyrin repeats (3 copies)
MYPNSSSVLPLPPNPQIEQYKKHAKALVRACRSGKPQALVTWATEWVQTLARLQGPATPEAIRESIRRQSNQLAGFARKALSSPTPRTPCTLTNAQFVIARAHGFNSWPQFAAHIGALTTAASPTFLFESAVDATIRGDIATLRRLLSVDQSLAKARSTRTHRLTLLHYLGANGFEGYRQTSPENAVTVATLLLDAGADVDAVGDGSFAGATTLGEVATSANAERAGVQVPLLSLLVDHGASVDGAPGGWNPLRSALHNGCLRAAEFLASRGARVDLETAAGVGQLDIVKSFFNADGTLRGDATKAQMESGFVLAAAYGRMRVVKFLLEKGVNLSAGENDQTALHLAAHRGQLRMVEFLLDQGAPLEAPNAYGATVLGQATWSCMNSGLNIDYLPIIEALVTAGARVAGNVNYPTGDARIDAVLRRYGATP